MASARSAPQQQQQQQLGPPNSARLAITSLCKVLRQYGVAVLEPETVRQAKFDGPVAAPMWRALHDTVLLILAGRGTGGAGGAGGTSSCALEPTSAAAAATALGRQWEAVSHELLDVALGAGGAAGGSFPAEGAALVVRQLAAWGAPPALLAALRPPGAARAGAGAARHPHHHSYSQEDRAGGGADCDGGGGSGDVMDAAWGNPASCRSRPLLLALGWLVAAARLFERRIAELEPGPEARALLPPYPPDSCLGPTTQAAYETAAQEARQLVARSLTGDVAAGSSSGVPGAALPRSGGAGGLRSRAPPGDPFGPSAAAASREALWGDVEAAAQRAVMLCGRARGRMVTLQAAMDCRHRLTASLVGRQAAASPSSRPLTPYELQLAAQPAAVQRHAAALESATLALLEQQELAAHGALCFEWLGSVIEEEEQAAQQGGGAKGRGRAQAAAAAAASSPAAASSLAHLPYAGSAGAARLQGQLAAQLEAAVQAAAPELSAARQRAAQGGGGGGAGKPGAAAAGGASVSIHHFLALAEKAVSGQPVPGPDGDALFTPSPANGAAGAAGLLAGQGGGSAAPWSADVGREAGPWRLPDDVASALSAAQAAASERAEAELQAEAQGVLLRHGALARCDFSGGPGGAGAGGPLAAVLAGGGPAGGGVGGVAAGAETRRLLEAVLAVARPLARARAGHKAALRAALQELPEGYLVAGV